MARKSAKTNTESKGAPRLVGDFFGFEEIPFDARDFNMVQSDIFQKVDRALLSMEEDLRDREPREKELLHNVMKVSAWRNLRECLGASLQSLEKLDELEKYLLECANIFYKELDHPYWSTTQFQYLLHLNPSHPDYWAGYGMSLVNMQERGVWEEFQLEEKAAIAFKRAARLSVGHLLRRTGLMEKMSDSKMLERALRYYENAHALNPDAGIEEGVNFVKRLKKENEFQNIGELQRRKKELTDVASEIEAILSLKIERRGVH